MLALRVEVECAQGRVRFRAEASVRSERREIDGLPCVTVPEHEHAILHEQRKAAVCGRAEPAVDRELLARRDQVAPERFLTPLDRRARCWQRGVVLARLTE